MTRIIAIVMEKGGVGKTTTTLNLGDALALAGKRVLIVDLDAQRSLTQWCGISQADAKRLSDTSLSVYSALLKDADPNLMVIKRTDATGRPLASLLPGSEAMAGAADELNRNADAQFKLKDAFDRLETGWDVILIDCPPALTVVTVNALVAATHCIIPVKTDFISMAGLLDVLKTIRSATRLNPGLTNLGILPTIHSGHLKEDTDALRDLSEQLAPHGIAIFEPIPRNTRVDQSSSKGTSVVASAPDAKASRAYIALATQLIQRL